MKDKNRFSILLEHLMAIAELKNSILAKAVQYDDSYISKWISGKLLPTEKNHENTLQAISHCIVEALSEESTAQLLQEYQLQDINDLETAIYDNLESEYMYVKELQNSTGTEVAPKISYYPELTLDQFIFKMKHPSLRKVNSLNVYAIVDILNVDPNPDKPEKLFLFSTPCVILKKKGVFICYSLINTLIKFMASLPVMTA